MIGNLGRAVIRDVADENIAGRRGRARNLVVADAHSHDRAQPRKTVDVLGGDRVAHDHQAIDLGAVGGIEIGQRLDRAPHDADFRAEDLEFKAILRDLPLLGVEHSDGHGEILTGWRSAAERTIASNAETPCNTSSAVIGYGRSPLIAAANPSSSAVSALKPPYNRRFPARVLYGGRSGAFPAPA